VPLCPTCNAELESNARFCPKDGTTIRPDSVLVPMPSPSMSPSPSMQRSTEAGAFKPTVPLQTKKRADATTDRAADPLIGSLLDGRYRIRGRLGQGGVGAVYEAEHVQIKKTVALKVLHPIYASTDEFRKRFEREARAASRLSHPACVQVTDFGRVEKVEPPDERLLGTPYLVMEFVRGTVLVDRLVDGPRVSPTEAVAITRDLLAALKHAHGLGIVHRDLKPANVMLLATGDETATRVKLLDFGLAKELLSDAEAPLTQAGMVFGTPGYLSPEQAAGKKVDARCDLYSAGVMLFEMSCNRRLFERKDPLDAVRDHLNTPPPDPRSINPSLSPALSKVILKALEKQPEQRWPSAEAFAQALAEVPEAHGQVQAPIRQRLSSSGRRLLALRWRGRPAWQPVAAGAVLLLVVGLVLALRGSAAAPATKPTPMATGGPPAVAPPSQPRRPAALSDGARYAFDLVRSDRPDEALKVARDALRDDPRDGWAHAALAAAYAHKLWCSDALEELDKAVRDQPQLATRPELARSAMLCLGPKTNARASRFLVEKLGPDARAALQSAATADPNPELRRNAQRLLERLPQ